MSIIKDAYKNDLPHFYSMRTTEAVSELLDMCRDIFAKTYVVSCVRTGRKASERDTYVEKALTEAMKAVHPKIQSREDAEDVLRALKEKLQQMLQEETEKAFAEKQFFPAGIFNVKPKTVQEALNCLQNCTLEDVYEKDSRTADMPNALVSVLDYIFAYRPGAAPQHNDICYRVVFAKLDFFSVLLPTRELMQEFAETFLDTGYCDKIQYDGCKRLWIEEEELGEYAV